MKTIATLLFAALMIAGASTFANSNPESVRVISVKRDIFYFKVCRSFIGGTIEVYGENGQVICSDKIQNHKSILDFYLLDTGFYKIKIKKDDHEVTFGYTKHTPKPEVDASTEEPMVISMFQQG